MILANIDNMKKIEILSPAGSKESFIAAVEAGADAVYCGLQSFSARSKAQNFTHSEFYNYTNYARKNNVKVYVTLNTLIKQDEIKEAVKEINFIAAAGADAVIVQDFGVAEIIRQYFPSLKLHASTQAAIHNSYGVIEAGKAGFKRVVLARELSLQEIKSISAKTKTELEIFCHGALCFGVSGMCLMSSFIGGNSGNRGACAQPCRRRWNINNKSGFYISPKDLDLSKHIKELKNSGISSLKIEGRMKNPQYVYKTVKAYTMLLHADEKDPSYQQIINEAAELLSHDFARPKTTFNFTGKSYHIFSPEMPKQTGIYIGKVSSVQNGVIEIQTNTAINTHDTFKAVDAANDLSYKVNLSDTKQVNGILKAKTDYASIKKGMDIFKTSDALFAKHIENIIKSVKIDKEPLALAQKMVSLPKFKQNKENGRLFIKIDDEGWLKEIQKQKNDAAVILLLDKNKLKNIEKYVNFTYFELPQYIDEEDLPIFQGAVIKLAKQGKKAFFLNNLGHFLFFKNQEADIYAGSFLYALNTFSAEFLFGRGIKNFIFSVEDDFKNISLLAKNGINGIFYISGFPVLALSAMDLHKDLENGAQIISAKDSLQITRKDGKTYITGQYPVMLLNKKKKLQTIGIDKFLIDLSFIKPNTNYLSSVLNALNGKQSLQNNIEFNFERNLK